MHDAASARRAAGAGTEGEGGPSAVDERLIALFDSEELRNWFSAQRWYATKTRAVTSLDLVEKLELSGEPPLVLALAQARFAQGTHDLYQLPLVLSDGGDVADADAVADPRFVRALIALMDAGSDLETADGRFSFRHLDGMIPVDPNAASRPLGLEQSNSSIVLGERVVLKVFRHLEAGINPDLEVLHFLTAHGFPSIAALHGWYEYEGAALAGTLGVAQEFIPDGRDGWELALNEIPDAPDAFLERVAALGVTTAQLHNALASDTSDPAFSPSEPSAEALSLLSATIDEDVEREFMRLPDDPRLEPIAGRGEEIRERLAARAGLGTGGKQIRIHGDYHLGQTLDTPRGWMILDFEGEPARTLSERRVKRSPLRDVAGMLRSFAYATAAVELQRGRTAPPDFEQQARIRFLEQYFATVDRTLLPAGEATIINLLGVFELEKAIYELLYELNHRPDWVTIPVAGIVRILEN
jgi:predicted trehalose synthase